MANVAKNCSSPCNSGVGDSGGCSAFRVWMLNITHYPHSRIVRRGTVFFRGFVYSCLLLHCASFAVNAACVNMFSVMLVSKKLKIQICLSKLHYFAPGWGANNCDECICMSVCVSWGGGGRSGTMGGRSPGCFSWVLPKKHSKGRPTQKGYYTTRVVRHWYVIGMKNNNYTRYHIKLIKQ